MPERNVMPYHMQTKSLTRIARVEDGERVRLLPRPRTPSKSRVGTPCGISHAVQGLVQTLCERRRQKPPRHDHLCALTVGI